LKTFVNELLRVWVKWGLSVYFSRIEVSGTNHIPSKTPLIVIANHQNALLDPLLIATMTGLKPYFLARADLFKKPLFAKLLSIIQLIPVFRIRDGLSSISGNQESFSKCEELLAKNQAILIFPEGNHSLRRNVRPLSKGFTRIAFGAVEKYPSLPLSILPIGISYESHQQIGSAVRIEIGKPLKVASFMDDSRRLTQAASNALKKLTVYIPDEDYENTLNTLKKNHIPLNYPVAVRDFLAGQQSEYSQKRNYRFSETIRWIPLPFHWPLWLLWKGIKPSIKDPVFYGTFKFVIGLVGITIYYISILLLGWLLGYGAGGIIFVLGAFYSLLMHTKF
jgi:1-acyl-sn-glycerol-3-phosphate acyltransferase